MSDGEVVRVELSEQNAQRGRPRGSKNRNQAAKRGRNDVKKLAPAVPEPDLDIERLRKTADTPTRRSRAAYQMAKAMIPYDEIAEVLGYDSPAAAKTDVVALLAANVDTKDVSSFRMRIVAGLEDQLRRSISFASASSLRDSDGDVIANTQQLAWHGEARKDYEILARVTGAIAPTEVHLYTPESAELDAIVREIESAQGLEVLDAEVVELGDEDGEEED